MAEIKRVYHDEETTRAGRQQPVRESLELQRDLRASVEAKQLGIEGFLADLDARITRTRALLKQMAAPGAATVRPAGRKAR